MAVTMSIFMEHGDGHACFEGQSHPLGSRAHSGGGPSTAYLFFYDKQGRRGLVLEATHTLRVHVGDASSEWISRSAHFVVNPFPLMEGWCCPVATAEQQWQCTQTEFQLPVVPSPAMSESDSNPQLLGSAPLSTRRLSLADESTNV